MAEKGAQLGADGLNKGLDILNNNLDSNISNTEILIRHLNLMTLTFRSSYFCSMLELNLARLLIVDATLGQLALIKAKSLHKPKIF